MSQSERKVKINSTHDLPVKHQRQLLSISWFSAYYQSKAPCNEELSLMRHLDALHLRYPFYGARRLRDALLDEKGLVVNRKQARASSDDTHGHSGCVSRKQRHQQAE